MDAGRELPVRVLDPGFALALADRFDNTQQLVGEQDTGVVIAVFSWLILLEQADRLPCDVQIAVRLYFVDYPTGGHPAPRSNGINPKFNVHQRRL